MNQRALFPLQARCPKCDNLLIELTEVNNIGVKSIGPIKPEFVFERVGIAQCQNCGQYYGILKETHLLTILK